MSITDKLEVSTLLDIHCHILPGLDDGAKHMEQALAMAKIAVGQGVRGVVATPHFIDGTPSPSVQVVLDSVDRFRDALVDAGLALEVYPGMEVYLFPSLPEKVKAGAVLTLNNNGRYLLVELPLGEIPLYSEDVFFSLLLAGVTPVLAHPERNVCLDAGILAQWVERGVMTQINSGSLMGLHGKMAKRAAEMYLMADLVHVVASDAHSTKKRAGILLPARRKVERFKGTVVAEALFVSNPLKIIRGEPVEVRKPRIVSRLERVRMRLNSMVLERVKGG